MRDFFEGRSGGLKLICDQSLRWQSHQFPECAGPRTELSLEEASPCECPETQMRMLSKR